MRSAKSMTRFPVGDLDAAEHLESGLESGRRVAKMSTLLGHSAALDDDIEDAATGPVDRAFDELEGHGVDAVGDLQVIAEDAVANILVDRGPASGAGDRLAFEATYWPVMGPMSSATASGQSVPALVPGGPGQGQDVRREDPRPPVDAEQSVAAVAQGVGGIPAHPAGPKLGAK